MIHYDKKNLILYSHSIQILPLPTLTVGGGFLCGVQVIFADTFFIFFIVMLLNFKLSIHALTNKKSRRSSSFYQMCQQIFYTLILTM